MKVTCAILLAMLMIPAPSLLAQLEPPNEAGVTMGQFHTVVRDVEATKKVWIAIGGKPIKIDGIDVIKLPGVFVFITKGTPSGGSVGSAINHVGFIAPDNRVPVEKVKAAGFWADYRNSAFGGTPQGWVYTPDDLKMRFNTDKSLTVPIASPLVMLYTTTALVPKMTEWYAKMFGGTVGAPITNGLRVEGVPGVRLNFVTSEDARSYGPHAIGLIQGQVPPEDSPLTQSATRPPYPTKGRTLDRIGFEVKNLEAFCQKLEANGVRFDEPYSKSRHKSFGSASLTDPYGVSIELTEGLNRF